MSVIVSTIEFIKVIWAWRRAVSFGVCDQALTSVGNFLFAILLIRWMGIEAFGEFSIIMAFVMLVDSMVASILVQPMPYIASRFERRHQSCYQTAAFRIGNRLGLANGGLALLVGVIFLEVNPAIANAILASSFALTGIVIHHVGRRLCYAAERVGRSTIASICYAATLLGLTFVLHDAELLLPASAFGALGISSLLAASVCAGALVLHRRKLSFRRLLKVFFRHWQHGRWLAFSSLIAWSTNTALIPFLGIVMDARSAGVFRAFQQLMSPLAQGLAAVCWVVLPRIASSYRRHGLSVLGLYNAKVSLIFGLASLSYAIALIVCGPWLLATVFKWSDANLYFTTLIFVALAAFIDGFKQGLGLTLQAGGFFREISGIRIAGILVTAVAIWPLVYYWGVTGAFITLTLANIVIAVATAAIVARKLGWL